jgi:glycosyltransferase involved in cell wall biosynthesis
MQWLAEDPTAAAAMGRAGRARVESVFDWEKKVDAILELYTSVLPSDTITR